MSNSKMYYDEIGILNGVSRFQYNTFEPCGGDREGLLSEQEYFAWTKLKYSTLTIAEMRTILKWRSGSSGSHMTQSKLRYELRRLDKEAEKFGIKIMSNVAKYKNMYIKDVYDEARIRGYKSRDKSRRTMEHWLHEDDKFKLESRRDKVKLDAATALHAGEIDLAEFNTRCNVAQQAF